MPLSLDTVDWIFGRMAVRYGSAWAAKWAGTPIDVLKADWVQELAHCKRDSILYAMRYLPLDHPPNVAQFSAICARAPEVALPMLPAPDADPERVAIALGKARASVLPRLDRQWAVRLQAREVSGEKLSLVQRHAWREALGAQA